MASKLSCLGSIKSRWGKKQKPGFGKLSKTANQFAGLAFQETLQQIQKAHAVKRTGPKPKLYTYEQVLKYFDNVKKLKAKENKKRDSYMKNLSMTERINEIQQEKVMSAHRR